MTIVVRGHDLSHYQGEDGIDVARLPGAFILGKVTDGDGFFDPSWPHNRRSAILAGKAVGGFHFARPARPAAASARLFREQLQQTVSMLPPWLDLEDTGGLAPAPLHAWLHAWRDELALPSGTYVGDQFWLVHVAPAAAGCAECAATPLWLPRYASTMGPVPPPWREAAIWQSSQVGTAAILAGRPIDEDQLVSETLPQLIAYAAGHPLGTLPEGDHPMANLSADDADLMWHRLNSLAAAGELDGLLGRLATVLHAHDGVQIEQRLDRLADVQASAPPHGRT